MTPIESLAAFAVFSLMVVVVPGPSVTFVISRALILGKTGALLTVLGNGLGVLLQALAVAVGLGTLIESSELVMHLVRWGGAAFLIFMGVHAIRHRRDGLRRRWHGILHRGEDLHLYTPAPLSHPFVHLRDAFVVGATNPIILVFLTASLPQFIDSARGGVAWQILGLGIVFILLEMLGESLYALAAGTARDWFAKSNSRLITIRTVGGSVIAGLGVFTALVSA